LGFGVHELVLLFMFIHQVPKHYEKCPFYFWFHTWFVKDGRLLLKREDLDNPHKSKTWHCFRECFSVELSFEDSQR